MTTMYFLKLGSSISSEVGEPLWSWVNFLICSLKWQVFHHWTPHNVIFDHYKFSPVSLISISWDRIIYLVPQMHELIYGWSDVSFIAVRTLWISHHHCYLPLSSKPVSTYVTSFHFNTFFKMLPKLLLYMLFSLQLILSLICLLLTSLSMVVQCLMMIEWIVGSLMVGAVVRNPYRLE